MLGVPLLVAALSSFGPAADFHQWADRPPMGWNSWDSFGTTLTEAQAREQVDAMAEHLRPFGWNIFTVDIQWYEPSAKGHDYKPGAELSMDAFGRLTPALAKFPSAAENAGFKPLADYVHARGLKFGIHLMRGIPRQAVHRNTPVLGTSVHAADIALTSHTCPWNPDMYGVDMRKEGAQAYYDSLFAMYASWGVDFVKVDDISRAYDDVQKAEIEAIRRAIDRTGRPMVLSLSPGDTPIARGDHVNRHANMWRISDDFWDRWEPLHGMFGRLDRWTTYRRPGAWPDADMLPFGMVEFGRPTRFTRDEQRLCMTLWSIAKSPLIFGGDMTKLDAFTRDLLTNPEVLAVNQTGEGCRQVSRQDDLIVWTAKVPNSPDRFVALFNAQDDAMPYDLEKARFKSPVVRGPAGATKVDIDVTVKGAKTLTLLVTDGGDAFHYDHAAWLEPTLTGPKGTLHLADQPWVSAKAGWQEVRRNRTVDNQADIRGIGTHSVSLIGFAIPEGYERFRAQGILTAGSEGKGSVEFVVLTDEARRHMRDKSKVQVRLDQLGIRGAVQVRDLWSRKDLGRFADEFGQELPRHGAGLYRLSPKPQGSPYFSGERIRIGARESGLPGSAQPDLARHMVASDSGDSLLVARPSRLRALDQAHG